MQQMDRHGEEASEGPLAVAPSNSVAGQRVSAGSDQQMGSRLSRRRAHRRQSRVAGSMRVWRADQLRGARRLAGRYVDAGQHETVFSRRRPTGAPAPAGSCWLGVSGDPLGGRARRHEPHHLAAHHPFAATFARFAGSPTCSHHNSIAEPRSAGADIRGRARSARRTSECRGPDACRASLARCRARARRFRRRRRTVRRNRPSGRTTGNPDWPP